MILTSPEISPEQLAATHDSAFGFNPYICFTETGVSGDSFTAGYCVGNLLLTISIGILVCYSIGLLVFHF